MNVLVLVPVVLTVVVVVLDVVCVVVVVPLVVPVVVAVNVNVDVPVLVGVVDAVVLSVVVGVDRWHSEKLPSRKESSAALSVPTTVSQLSALNCRNPPMTHPTLSATSDPEYAATTVANPAAAPASHPPASTSRLRDSKLEHSIKGSDEPSVHAESSSINRSRWIPQ